MIGPSVHPLQAQAWKIKCPPKLKHFMWQAISGCLAVTSKLAHRGIRCDNSCYRCGITEETIAHALFECPPARQTWALSSIPSSGSEFPTPSVYTNFDHLFWRLMPTESIPIYPWILWYIWKSRNDKIFNNIDRSPQDIIQMAEKEALAWANAQLQEGTEVSPPLPTNGFPSQAILRCYTDGSWINKNESSGLGWFCTKKNHEGFLMGARNVSRKLSPLHSEFAALLWAMRCMVVKNHLSVDFFCDSTNLVQMISSPSDWPAFTQELKEFSVLRNGFVHINISYISRSQNIQADSLAKYGRQLSSNLYFINSVPPV